MKKLLYSITALLTIFMVGCTKFDEATSEQYAPAPDFSIDATAAVADSSATFKIAIDKVNTTRFSVALLNDSMAVEEYPEAMTLLKGNVDPKDRVCKFNADTLVLRNDTTISYVYKDLLVQITGDAISYTYSGLDPNTSYTFVAVVSNKFGLTGDVKGLSVTTTDNLAPTLSKASRSESYGSLTLAFSENMQRGDGKVSVKYYAPYDFSITGTVPEENINCDINGKEISVSCDSVPAGALMLVSWEAGAFKDIKGNNCNAVVTEMNMKTGRVDNGCYYMVANEPFSFTKAGVEKLGESFVDYTTFMPTISYSKPLYVQYDEDDEIADIMILYVKDDVRILLPALWDVADTAIVLGFKKEMDYGAKISFTIPEGAVVDAFGNPNKEFVIEDAWMRSYGLTDDDIVGLYNVQYASAVTDGEVAETSMLITRSGDGLKVSRLFYDETCLDAHFDGDMGILYIDDFQYMTTLYGSYDIYFVTGVKGQEAAQLQYNPETKSFFSGEEAEVGQYYINTSTGKSGWMDYTYAIEAVYSEDQDYGYDKDLMVGDYRFIYHDYYDDEDPESLDTITCSIVAGDNDTTLIIKDFVFEGSEIVAYFDTVSGKLVIPDWQFVGMYYSYECYMSTYDLENITFNCSPDGTAWADGAASESNMLWGIAAWNGSKVAGWLRLSEGDLYLEPYDPEEESAETPMRQASSARNSLELHTDMLPKK
ncbi:MAG: hypothetical protein J6P66_03340 [Bacteroidaceae bacterium]|nr:hypothetical protein [Bacteroidaceae bacterium]